jgi:hypothetical protein
VIKFVGAKPGDGRTVVGLGLSAENLRRLQQDKPIVVELRELGFAGPPHLVLIFAGDTEEAMTERLRELGAIGPDTKMHVDLAGEGWPLRG